MDTALLGFLVIFGTFHLLLIVMPVMRVFQAPISVKSKIAWCALVILVPIIGVAIMHFRYRIGLFHGPKYERGAADIRASSGTLSPDDRE